MESYNGKLYVGTFDIGSLAYPLMQVTNGDILKRSPEEWKTQFEYIIKLLELLKAAVPWRPGAQPAFPPCPPRSPV